MQKTRRFTVSRSELEKDSAEKSAPQVMAVAEGQGCDWAKVGPAAERAREKAGVPQLFENFEALAAGQQLG